MRYPRTAQAGDFIRTVWRKERRLKEWRGKVRRVCGDTGFALIEWRSCGGLPTDICTWVHPNELHVTRRPKP